AGLGHTGPLPRPRPGRRGRRGSTAAPVRRRLLAAVRPLRRSATDGGRRVVAARPVAAHRLGRDRAGGTAVSWEALLTAALIGTERAVVPAPPDGLATDVDPAGALLDQAALLAVARRAGRPASAAEPLPPAEATSRPAVSQAAGRRLARILN